MIIDLGCGTGRYYDFIHNEFPLFSYIGVDIDSSPESKSRNRSDFTFLPYDGIHLPFKDCSVDIIFMNQVLEHVRAPHLLFPEIYRCLKNDGILLGSVSQLEPYHSFSVMNYTFYGICSFLDLFNFNTFKLRPGIDSYSLISRTLNKFILKRSHSFEDIFFNSESMLSYAIYEYLKNKSNVQQINLNKLIIAGQFSFAAKKI